MMIAIKSAAPLDAINFQLCVTNVQVNICIGYCRESYTGVNIIVILADANIIAVHLLAAVRV